MATKMAEESPGWPVIAFPCGKLKCHRTATYQFTTQQNKIVDEYDNASKIVYRLRHLIGQYPCWNQSVQKLKVSSQKFTKLCVALKTE